MALIRKMEEKDIETVYNIEKDAFSLPWSKGAFANSLDDEFQLFFVAEEEGHIAGYVGIMTVCKEVNITNIAVDKEKRRQGIANKLMDYVIQYARDNKDDIIYLEVRKSNEKAQKLYEKVGFEIIGERKNFYTKPVEDAILMSRGVD